MPPTLTLIGGCNGAGKTTGRTYVRTLRSARSLGYQVVIHYLIIASPEQAVERVAMRVKTARWRRESRSFTFHLFASPAPPSSLLTPHDARRHWI